MVLSEDRHGERERRAFPLSNHFRIWSAAKTWNNAKVEVLPAGNMVLYVSEVDHRHYRRLLPNLCAEHLPTLAEAGKTGPGFQEREGILFLGNFENLANRDGLRWLVQEVWPRVQKRNQIFKLYVAGNALTPKTLPRRKEHRVLGKVTELGDAFAARRVLLGRFASAPASSPRTCFRWRTAARCDYDRWAAKACNSLTKSTR